MDFLKTIVFIVISFALAFIVEALVEYFAGTPIEFIPRLKPWKKYILGVIAGIAGVLLALYWKIDLIAAIAALIVSMLPNLAASGFIWQITPVGMVLSGLAIGRGSNFLHQWLSNSLKKPDVLPLPAMSEWVPGTTEQRVS